MKYAELAIGLLIGTALGGAIIATSAPAGAAGNGMSKDEVRAIVLDVIKENPQAIIDSLQNYQDEQRDQQTSKANDLLKDPTVQDAIYGNEHAPFVGPKDSKKTIVEFFDYNCPACKMQYGEIAKIVDKDKDVKVIFMEYPIFGPQSEANSRIGIAVFRLAGDKYFDFHSKMMTHEGRVDEKTALAYAHEIGLDPAAVKKEAQSKEVANILGQKRELGNKLQLSGTPTLVVDGELIPHAASQEDLEAMLNKPQ